MAVSRQLESLPAVHAPASDGDERRRPWLVLADDGPAREAAERVGPSVAHLTGQPDSLHATLLEQRPRLVLAAAPPARAADLRLLADVRRRRPGLRIVLVDAPSASAERLAALEDGFDDALPSSIPAVELLGRVRLLLEREPGSTAARIPRRVRVSPTIEIDLAAHQAWRDGRPIHLRPKEFGLLAVLATHPGRAFTREELLGRVWGPERQADGRTVDVHVRWLRAKIERDPGQPEHLVTVRGLGYRLDPAR
ncbi:MAG TPA: response regulator transcription factor [Candidatus Dormibacteraeota bacterium]|nr:response regulator transcription factor [Candidatus Dormibacteraeota bacterium]